jgi:septum formation protein
MRKRIILASQSPRRKQLLEQAEIVFDILVIPTNETFPAQMPFDDVPVYIAIEKAKLVAIDNADAIVLAADTIVVLEDEIIGKPADEADAIHILEKLSGKEHLVITGVCIRYQEQQITFRSTTKVLFNTLSASQIQHYVHHYQPFDKAGAYAIQEWIGAIGIASIHGDYYNVMGLPIHKVVEALETLQTGG